MANMMKLACVAILCMVALAPHAESAVSCGTIVSKLSPCISYLTGKAGLTPACCGSIKALVSLANTPADRKTACLCLKSAAGAIKGLNYGSAAGLPSKCGARVPYAVSPSTDCSKVH